MFIMTRASFNYVYDYKNGGIKITWGYFKLISRNVSYSVSCRGILVFPGEDYRHKVLDECLCMVAGCTLGTDVCHWMFKNG